MQCAKHPEHEAGGMCAWSGKPFCSHELVEVNGRMIGKDYLDKVFAAAKESGKAQAPQVFMNAGGGGAAAAAGGALVQGKKPINHPLHILLSICTGGIWLVVYLPLLLMRSCG